MKQSFNHIFPRFHRSRQKFKVEIGIEETCVGLMETFVKVDGNLAKAESILKSGLLVG